jgi:cephalosporin-C deacetylase
MGTSIGLLSKKGDLFMRRSFYYSWLTVGLSVFLLQSCNIFHKTDAQIIISPVMERGDHLFLGKGPVVFKIIVDNHLDRELNGEIRVSAQSDFGVEIPGFNQKISLKPRESTDIKIDFGLLEPGFYNVESSVQSGEDQKQIRFALGVRPEEIISPLDRPDDFEEYWIRARKELGEVDPRFKMIRQDSLCTKKREVYILEMQSLGDVTVRGWYARPVKEGVYPAILHVQGYSTFMIPDWMYQGDDMVALGLNIRGHGFSQDQVNPGFPGYLQHHLDDKEQYIYRGAYMDCIRAVDFL